MQFTVKKCPIEGLIEIEPKVFGDNRGYFFESWNKRDFDEAGLSMRFVQDNQSCSSKGVLRGLHFQKKHPQGKLVRALNGKLFDVAVDLRKGSETFGKYYGIILDSSKHNMFYIPEGFAHGFVSLTDNCIQSYKCTDFYYPDDEEGIPWDDSTIAIDWEKAFPGISECAVLSEKDTHHLPFDKTASYFDQDGNWIGK